MSMAIEWSGIADIEIRKEPRRAGMTLDAPLSAVLEKAGDRLLRDAGLTREDALGAEEAFRREWRRQRQPWML